MPSHATSQTEGDGSSPGRPNAAVTSNLPTTAGGRADQTSRYCADQDGVPLIAGRILGWLVVCDPPEQSAGQIAEAIGASRASLTTNLRLLGSVGFVRQVTKPGTEARAFEVDTTTNIDAKRARVTAALGAVPAHVRLVPVDLESDDLAESLAANGSGSTGRRCSCGRR